MSEYSLDRMSSRAAGSHTCEIRRAYALIRVETTSNPDAASQILANGGGGGGGSPGSTGLGLPGQDGVLSGATAASGGEGPTSTKGSIAGDGGDGDGKSDAYPSGVAFGADGEDGLITTGGGGGGGGAGLVLLVGAATISTDAVISGTLLEP
jgi:hypothetical protein